MPCLETHMFFRLFFSIFGGFGAVACLAQPAGLLYDPEPPPNSAYVRVIQTAQAGLVSVWVDGKKRISALQGNQVSAYLVVPEGGHELQLRAIPNHTQPVTARVQVSQAKSYTVAFLPDAPTHMPVVFEDPSVKNKLKAMLYVYQLAYPDTPVDITVASSKVVIFRGLRYPTSQSLQVNPIQVKLLAVTPDAMAAPLETSLDLAQSTATSLFLTRDKRSNPVFFSVQNTVERFTGK